MRRDPPAAPPFRHGIGGGMEECHVFPQCGNASDSDRPRRDPRIRRRNSSLLISPMFKEEFRRPSGCSPQWTNFRDAARRGPGLSRGTFPRPQACYLRGANRETDVTPGRRGGNAWRIETGTARPRLKEAPWPRTGTR